MTTASKDGSWQDPLDVRRARHAPGLLRPFNDAGVLGVADVQVAVGLGRLVPEPDEQVLLAAALAVRALRLGSVCVDLAQVRHTVTVDLAEPTDVQALPWPEVTGWLQACAASAAVAFAPDAAIPDPAIPDPAIPDAAIPDAIAARADPPETRTARPLRLAGTRLYLDRYFREEESVAINVLERSCRPGPAVDVGALRSGLARLFPGSGPDGQRLAAAVAALRWLTVLAGGPGTGKTTTIARMLALLCAQPGEPPRIALAAPTGKAAARLEEAIRDALARLSPEDRARLGELRASTLHRLLGARPDTRTRFRHDRHNRLPHDVVVVDETSMVSLSLMDRLLDAVRPGARLVLVGDPDQLASVEAGAVLGDVIGPDAVSPRRSAAMRARVEEMAPGDLTAEDGWPAAEPPGLPAPPDQPRPTLSVGDGVVLLRRTWRFGGQIAELAAAVQRGLADQALDLLAAAADDVSFIEIPD
ncbi:MAG: AAA family ATPase, partial [Frankiaceae bacterium]